MLTSEKNSIKITLIYLAGYDKGKKREREVQQSYRLKGENYVAFQPDIRHKGGLLNHFA